MSAFDDPRGTRIVASVAASVVCAGGFIVVLGQGVVPFRAREGTPGDRAGSARPRLRFDVPDVAVSVVLERHEVGATFDERCVDRVVGNAGSGVPIGWPDGVSHSRVVPSLDVVASMRSSGLRAKLSGWRGR